MDFKAFLESVNITDVLVVVFLFAMFILGWAQGAVRRLIGIGTMTFSFFLAAQLHLYLGNFLADHWYQYPPSYSYMIAFMTLFVAASIAFALVVQGTYERVTVFARHPVIDELLGGVLGVTQGLLLIMFTVIALDTFYLVIPAAEAGELPLLRDLWLLMDASLLGHLLHENAIPTFMSATALFVPETVRIIHGVP